MLLTDKASFSLTAVNKEWFMHVSNHNIGQKEQMSL